jgi:TolB-like protein
MIRYKAQEKNALDLSFTLQMPLLLVGFVVALQLATAPRVAAQEAILDEAKDLYRFADYAEAATLLEEVIADRQIDIELRQEAYRYLARSFVARGQTDRAQHTIENLITTEPPAAAMDPNVEPPAVMDMYYRAMKEQQGNYSVDAVDGRQTLAVMDFTNNSFVRRGDYEGLRLGLSSALISHLIEATDIHVIERERIEWLLNELELQQEDDVVDQSTAVETGRLLGAQVVMFGGFIATENEMQITVRIVDVETGVIIVGSQVEGKVDYFFDLIGELGEKVTSSINAEMQGTQPDRALTRSLDAMMAYSEGLQLLERGRYQEAEQKFQNAIAYDEDFSRARQKMESIQPMIAAQEQGYEFQRRIRN